MNPGRELDAAVAEIIFGLKVVRSERGVLSIGPERWYDFQGDMQLANPVPLYSQEITDAWEVVEHFRSCTIMTCKDGWQAQLIPKNSKLNFDVHISYGKTAPHAICLAALRSVAKNEKE